MIDEQEQKNDTGIVAKGGGAELCHIDWFAFSR